mmetsp:Transcript_111884/g.311421  ORF Transcript_111884/g.311421 Transcript_111884/m.311421 type:complete len:282 (-) Transcript_111884:284-1129(-)
MSATSSLRSESLQELSNSVISCACFSSEPPRPCETATTGASLAAMVVVAPGTAAEAAVAFLPPNAAAADIGAGAPERAVTGGGAAFSALPWTAPAGSCVHLAAMAAAGGKLNGTCAGGGAGASDAGTAASKSPTFSIAATSSFRCSTLHVLSFSWSPSLIAAEISAARFSSPGGSTKEPATMSSGLIGSSTPVPITFCATGVRTAGVRAAVRAGPVGVASAGVLALLAARNAAFCSTSRVFSSRSWPASPLSLAFLMESSSSSSPRRRTPSRAFRWRSMAS